VDDHTRAPQLFGGLSMFGAHKMAEYIPLLEGLVDGTATAQI